MTRCPLCRALYRGGETCRRCRVDLQIVLDIEHNARQLAHHAVLQLLDGNSEQAERLADKAVKQHSTRFHSLLHSFILRKLNTTTGIDAR